MRVLVPTALVVTIILLIVGSVVQVITFTFRGIAGIAIALIDPSLSQNTQSAVSIGVSIINGARPTTESQLAIVFLQILYLMFALIVPLLVCTVLLVIWMVPLTLKEQLLLYFMAEVLSAWEAVVVLLFSLIAAVLQISQLAQFIVNAATGNLCAGLQTQLARFFPDPQDAQCFNVIAELQPATAILGLACAMLYIWGGIAFRLVHAAITDRELAMRRKPPHSPGHMRGCYGWLVRRSLEAFGQRQVPTNNIANQFAQQQGLYGGGSTSLTPSMSYSMQQQQQTPSMNYAMQMSNPVMQSETSKLSSSNPQFSANYAPKPHMSIDV